jgi:Protein of unknown function DUF262/Protein of unknown function (DUF1524)
MKANAVPVVALFEKKHILEVPLFQRQYVWGREQQWEPLWEDLSRKFTEHLDGRIDGPVHFLGAMVLDQKQTPTTHVERRQVIDGQQRLTTLQVFLAVFRDLCAELGFAPLSDECEQYTLNKGLMARPEVDCFKVWPTQADRGQFADVMTARSRNALEQKHPLTRRAYARKYNPRPRMVEAYVFFYDCLREFFLGADDEPAAGGQPLVQRLDACLTALKSSLQVVVIDLDKDDDAQVIFETLNARGEPLLPADLLRNFIFLRAGRLGEDQESLYEEFWAPFDDPFWRKEVRQGRLSRPRSDLFMQHFLASRQCTDIPAKHLFVEYKYWIESARPFSTVRDELATLARQREFFRTIVAPRQHDVIAQLATFLDRFDMSTSYPLLLHLAELGLSNEQWDVISKVIESYLLRRAVCGLTPKNYNRIFLSLARALRRDDGETAQRLEVYLATLRGESSEWPTDDVFERAWNTQHVYQAMGHPKVIHVLRRLSDAMLGPMHERVTIDGPLSVEHILPQSWEDAWPLQDGSRGLSYVDLWSADEANPIAQASRIRNAALHTIGNLTILTQSLNASVSNGPWAAKKPAILRNSFLPLNQDLYEVETWDEAAIAKRSARLFEIARTIWPPPRSVA